MSIAKTIYDRHSDETLNCEALVEALREPGRVLKSYEPGRVTIEFTDLSQLKFIDAVGLRFYDH